MSVDGTREVQSVTGLSYLSGAGLILGVHCAVGTVFFLGSRVLGGSSSGAGGAGGGGSSSGGGGGRSSGGVARMRSRVSHRRSVGDGRSVGVGSVFDG